MLKTNNEEPEMLKKMDNHEVESKEAVNKRTSERETDY